MGKVGEHRTSNVEGGLIGGKVGKYEGGKVGEHRTLNIEHRTLKCSA